MSTIYQPDSRTCDRCDCTPIVRGQELRCPGGGPCVGQSQTIHDGKGIRRVPLSQPKTRPSAAAVEGA